MTVKEQCNTIEMLTQKQVELENQSSILTARITVVEAAQVSSAQVMGMENSVQLPNDQINGIDNSRHVSGA